MKKLGLLSVLLMFVNLANAELTEKYEHITTTIYVSPIKVPAPPKPPVAISLKVAKPNDTTQAEILKAIANTNALRAEQGLPPLRYDENLAAYAQFRASEIEQKFSHERPNGEMYRTAMGIGKAVGENIAAGRQSADDAVLQFKNSPKHYKTLMHDEFTKIGMGTVYVPNSTYKYYWVQIFGADNTSSPASFELLADNGNAGNGSNASNAQLALNTNTTSPKPSELKADNANSSNQSAMAK